MGDLVPKNDGYTPTSVLAKQCVTAIGCVAGGVVLLVVGAVPGWLGIALGVVAAVIGLGGLISKDPEDKKVGAVVIAAGALFILSKVGFLKGLAGFLMGAGAIGLFAIGIWKGIQFFKGLKTRS